MSHKHNSSAVHNIQILPLYEVTQQYGIEIDNDGSVWDTVEGIGFKNLNEWAIYIDELNNEDLYDNFSKIGHRHEFDDGY